jgi:16S rRNA U1498 N3-methylase RsmE
VPRRDVIDALRQCAERHAPNLDVQHAVRQAIAEIQSRLPGASPGQLSLAGAEAGQVSLAGEGQRGQVSLEKPGV